VGGSGWWRYASVAFTARPDVALQATGDWQFSLASSASAANVAVSIPDTRRPDRDLAARAIFQPASPLSNETTALTSSCAGVPFFARRDEKAIEKQARVSRDQLLAVRRCGPGARGPGHRHARERAGRHVVDRAEPVSRSPFRSLGKPRDAHRWNRFGCGVP
jgi:hypothetical protein